MGKALRRLRGALLLLDNYLSYLLLTDIVMYVSHAES